MSLVFYIGADTTVVFEILNNILRYILKTEWFTIKQEMPFLSTKQLKHVRYWKHESASKNLLLFKSFLFMKL